MKKLLVLVNLLFLCLNTFSQSYDEKIAQAMNESDWFKLDSLYNETPKDQISISLKGTYRYKKMPHFGAKKGSK